jgi:hypothetical protein
VPRVLTAVLTVLLVPLLAPSKARALTISGPTSPWSGLVYSGLTPDPGDDHQTGQPEAQSPICASRGHWSFDSRFVEVHRCENEQCTHLFAVSVDSNHGVMNAVVSDAEESICAARNERAVLSNLQAVCDENRKTDLGEVPGPPSSDGIHRAVENPAPYSS